MSRTVSYLLLAATLVVVALLAGASSKGGQPGVPSLEVPKEVAPPAPVGNGLVMSVEGTHRLVSSNGGEFTAEVTVKAVGAVGRTTGVSMALVLDRSGSMTGDKLVSAKNAARQFVTSLGNQDELALVHFGSDVAQYPLTRMSPEGKREMLGVIDGIEASGGTNISGGMRAGAEVLTTATGTRRLVLVSDGQPTEGETGDEQLFNLAVSVHTRGIAVSAFGVGADYNGVLMTRIAEGGGGYYAYLRDAGQLSEVLAMELAQARNTFARNVTLTFRLPEGVTLASAAGRSLMVNTVALPDLKQGDEARVLVKLRLTAAEGTVRQLMTPVLQWTRATDAKRELSELTLSAGVAHDAVAVAKSRDEMVFARAVTAEGTEKVVAAAAAMDRGDRSAAEALLDAASSIFRTSSSANALAGAANVERKEQLQKGKGLKEMARETEAKSLSAFGQNNSY